MSKSDLRCKNCGEIGGHKKNCSKQVHEKCDYCAKQILKTNYKEHRATCVKRKDSFKKERPYFSNLSDIQDLDE